MIAILMVSTKLAIPSLSKVKVCWNKGYEVIRYVYDVINKILLRNSNHIVDVVMWPKFGESSIYYKKFNFIKIWLDKLFFWGVVLVIVQ